MLESNNSSDSNAIRQLTSNQREIMSNVLKELKNLTKKAKCIEQSCLKPNKLKEIKCKPEKRSREQSIEKPEKRLKIKKTSTKSADEVDLNESANLVSQQSIEDANQRMHTTEQVDQEPQTSEQANQEQAAGQPTASNSEQLSNIIQSEFKCSICQEIIVNATSLQCSHTFCKVSPV